jgi:hypothetical protein
MEPLKNHCPLWCSPYPANCTFIKMTLLMCVCPTLGYARVPGANSASRNSGDCRESRIQPSTASRGREHILTAPKAQEMLYFISQLNRSGVPMKAAKVERLKNSTAACALFSGYGLIAPPPYWRTRRQFTCCSTAFSKKLRETDDDCRMEWTVRRSSLHSHEKVAAATDSSTTTPSLFLT